MPTKPKYILRKRFLPTKQAGQRWWDIDGNYLEGFLCGRRLVRYFAVPKRATALIVTVYEHAGPDRVRVEYPVDGDVTSFFAAIDGKRIEFNLTLLRILYKATKGKTVYAGIEYEE